MSDRGFFVIAQNNATCDYIRQAYYLANSIKNSQRTFNKISLMTNDLVPEQYKSVFDNIIPIPFEDHANNSSWKVENRWKAYHASPYDKTILLDADMLFFTDIEYIWKKLENTPIFFTSSVTNFKGQIIKDTVYRKTFIENDLPNLYSGFCYFEKRDTSLEFWKLVEYITYNWQRFYYDFSPKQMQKFYSLDVTVSIAAKILGIENIINNTNICTFTHMKSQIQGLDVKHEDWTKSLQVEIYDSDTVFINNVRQTGILHYVEDSFLEEYINVSRRR
jgi:hypothetical protein